MFVTIFLLVFALCSANQKIFEGNVEFQHLAVDENSGHIFIGAVNRLFELSEDLIVEKWIPTGPLNTSDSKLTDNDNKVLLIDDSRRLIVCGTTLGVCSSRNLNNIYIGCDVPIAVVPKEDVSTVVFLAAGPPTSNRSKRILYLATEAGSDGDVPTISGRLLDQQNDFKIANTILDSNVNQVKGTKIYLNSMYKDDVNIKYVYGFGSGIFSYFLKTQKKNGAFHSFIGRVCQDDDDYYNSYTEIPILCQSIDNSTYDIVQSAFIQKPGRLLADSMKISINDDVLFIAFSSDSDKSNSLQKTALCVFSLLHIRKQFADNIQKCFNGEGSRRLGVSNPEPCVKTDVKVNYEDVCGLNVNVPLDGDIPVVGTALIDFPGIVSALISKTLRDHTIVVAGTATGHLKKIIVDNTSVAVEYQDLIIQEGIAINKDLRFDSKNKYLYAMTKNRISKIPIEECDTYKSYKECFKDLHCGWCSVNRKCTSESECKYEDPLLWTSTDSESQAVITDVTPDNIFITSKSLLIIKIENIDIQEQMFCNFMLEGMYYITNATKVDDDIHCDTPEFNSSITYNGLDPIPVKLSLKNSLTDPAFATTVVTFLDCNSYSSCTECIANTDCSWCLYADRCTRDPIVACLEDLSINSHQTKVQDFCPAIIPPDDVKKYIPSGEKVKMHLKVQLVGNFILQSRFLCRFYIEEKLTTVPARLLADIIYCDEVTFEYGSNIPENIVNFDIIWGGTKKLDNPGKMHIVLYKCDKMANSLDTCSKLPKLYSCKWCDKSNSCAFQDSC